MADFVTLQRVRFYQLSKLEGHTAPVTCVLPGGAYTFSGSSDCTVNVWGALKPSECRSPDTQAGSRRPEPPCLAVLHARTDCA
jgi:WD40 repeat protein